MHLVLKAWILSSVSKQSPCFTAIEENLDDKETCSSLELSCKGDSVSSPDPV